MKGKKNQFEDLKFEEERSVIACWVQTWCEYGYRSFFCAYASVCVCVLVGFGRWDKFWLEGVAIELCSVVRTCALLPRNIRRKRIRDRRRREGCMWLLLVVMVGDVDASVSNTYTAARGQERVNDAIDRLSSWFYNPAPECSLWRDVRRWTGGNRKSRSWEWENEPTFFWEVMEKRGKGKRRWVET